MNARVGRSRQESRPPAGSTRPLASGAGQARRRQQILEAAIELLEEGEYDKIQVRDIAGRAGVALATMYRYFASKDQVYAAALLHWSMEFFQRVERRGGHSGRSDAERLRLMIGNTLLTLERWPQFIRAMTMLDPSTDPSVQAHLHAFYEKNAHALRLCVQDLDPQTAQTVVMVIHGVYSMQVRLWAQNRLSIDDVADQLEQAVSLIFRPAAAAGDDHPTLNAVKPARVRARR
jgi:AcrR family transcriptional regulator